MSEQQKSHPPLSKPQLRRQIRLRRRGLNKTQLLTAAQNLSKSAQQCSRLWQASRVLSYAAFEGEISPALLEARLSSKALYHPRINNYRTCRMQFFKADAFDTFNRYGIKEPKAQGTPLSANQFDVILLPLVAFDRRGNRVGMGAGYYDRALAALRHQPSTRPFLLGVAHSFQEIDQINVNHWDIPVDAILTDEKYIPIN